MNKTTKDYDKFKLLPQNRPIDKAHVKHMAHSIDIRNMLDKFPILVTKNHEVIDGQHRLEACRLLNIPVVYRVDDDLGSEDIIQLNTSRKWNTSDYFNYYVQLKVPAYVELQKWLKKTGLTFRVGTAILGIAAEKNSKQFRDGKMEFKEDGEVAEYELIKDSLEVIQRHTGFKSYHQSAKFWKGMLFLVRSPEFNKEHWFKNLNKMASRVDAQITVREYLKMFITIYNYYAPHKIILEKIVDESKY